MKKVNYKSKRYIKFGIVSLLVILVILSIVFAIRGITNGKGVVYGESVSTENYDNNYSSTNAVVEEQDYSSSNSFEDDEWNEYDDAQLNELQEYTSDKEKQAELKRKATELSMGDNNHIGRWGEEIFDYIPKCVLLRPGKSAFIGQEYGFIYSAVDDCKKYDYETNSYVRYYYDKNGTVISKEPYVFKTNHCSLSVDLIIFSIDRELINDREYKVTSTVLFNTNYGRIERFPDEQENEVYITRSSNKKWFLADPSITVSVENKYGNFSSRQYGIGISQARNNFLGYKGIKTNKYQIASDIETSIISLSDLPSYVSDGGKPLIEYDKTSKIIDTVTGCGKIIKKGYDLYKAVASTVAMTNPYTAAAMLVVEGVKQIGAIINNKTVQFERAYANNENNILTFPPPSKGLTRNVITSFGINTELTQNDQNKDEHIVNYNNLFNFKDGIARPNIILGEREHYSESIFQLTDTNIPTVLTSGFTASFALDKSYDDTSDIKKFNIPQRFNYSYKSVNLFDTIANERITEGSVDNIAYFNEGERKISLNVSQSGWYDLSLADVTPIAKLKINRTAKNIEKANKYGLNNFDSVFNSGMYLPLELGGNESGQKINLCIEDGSGNGNKTQNVDVSGGNAKVKLYLYANKENSFNFSLSDNLTYSYDMSFVGASFSANLHRHYEEIPCDGQAQSLKFNEEDWGYYSVTSGETGIYRISVKNAEFSLYDPMFYKLNDKQQSAEIIMSANQTYYICAKRIDSGRLAFAKFEKISEKTEFNNGNEKKFEFDLSENKNSQIYAARIGRTGIYTFNYDTGKDAAYSLQVKDGSLREYLFGVKKVYLTAGDYYFVFRNNGTGKTNGEVTVEFTPKQITTEKVTTVESDTYFSFIPPLSGYYTLNLSNGNFAAEAEGFAANGENRYYFNAGQRYIIKIAKNVAGSANANFSVSFTPSAKVTYHQNFNDKAAEFTTDITGYYSFNGENIALYDNKLVLICDGKEGFGCKLTAGEKYFIINSGNKDCIVNLEGEKITANFEANISEGEKYLKFIAPEDGYYKIKAQYGTTFEVYAYNNLSSHTAEPSTADGYYLSKGCTYYLKAYLSKPDFITVYNGKITALPEIPEGTFAEVDLNGEVNYAASYKFVPDATGDYTFIFSRNLKKNFKIFIDGSEFTFENGSNVLKITKSLNAGKTYEITFNLTEGAEGTLIFGVCRSTFDFSVSVDNVKQFDGAVNKIAVGGDKSEKVSAQISVSGASSHVNYNLLNPVKLANGEEGITVGGDGKVTVSNSLPQWTAFAVEVNVGRLQYGDIVLDGGVSKVINFLIYVDVEDIKILGENNEETYNIDIAHKQTINLTAAVFPSHAFKAESLTYDYADEDGSKYVELIRNGYKAEVTAKPTAPNDTYVKIYVHCGDEFGVIIVVRVHTDVIYAANYEDINISTDSTKTAYEIVLNGDIVDKIITVPSNINYLKIRRGGSNKLTKVAIKVNSDNLFLILDSIELRGVINAYLRNLELHFIGGVLLYGADSPYRSYTKGEDVIIARDLKITKADNYPVEIKAGNGFIYSDEDGIEYSGDGGVALNCSGAVELIGVSNLAIYGGRGADGEDGRSASAVRQTPPATADERQDGVKGIDALPGEPGMHGGHGGAAIECGSLKISKVNGVHIYGGDGGHGGAGGNGADGGPGGKGGIAKKGDAGQGGRGGHGSDGGAGGNGGNGSVAVKVSDTGKLEIQYYTSFTVKAGDAGNGGHGGDGGDDKALFNGDEGPGGVGGNGGNGGLPGTPGAKGSSIDGQPYNATGNDGLYAEEGYRGLGGTGGCRGDKGITDNDVEDVAASGSNGSGRVR